MIEKAVETDFNPETGFFLLRLRKEDVGLGNEPVTVQGKTFRPKDEVHLTIFGSALGQRLAERMAADEGLEVAIRRAIAETGWSYQLQDDWYHVVREDEAESIIRMVAVPPLEAFYMKVETVADLTIPERPAHVTLYTWQDDEGIGIATWEEFERRVVGPVSPEQLR